MAGNVFCVKCRKHTSNSGQAKLQKAKNGRHFMAVKCGKCGTKKVKFISAKQVKEMKKMNGGFLPLVIGSALLGSKLFG